MGLVVDEVTISHIQLGRFHRKHVLRVNVSELDVVEAGLFEVGKIHQRPRTFAVQALTLTFEIMNRGPANFDRAFPRCLNKRRKVPLDMAKLAIKNFDGATLFNIEETNVDEARGTFFVFVVHSNRIALQI